MNRRLFLSTAAPLLAQTPPAPAPAIPFTCPMDRDVQQPNPGKCPRCGMALVANLPEPIEYLLDLRTTPRPIQPAKPATLEFAILHPRTRRPVREFEVMHEKLFHLFVISGDLTYFAHEHPTPLPNGRFRFETTLPKPGTYRIACDLFPKGATPQFLTRTIFTAGAELKPAPILPPDLVPKRAANLEVTLTTQPAQPLAGLETLMFATLRPADGLEPYLGAYAHMLAASDDLIDVVHDHPLYAYPTETDRPQIQFNMLFPRERTYRVWMQFQRKGIVNTAAFNVPVKMLR